MAQGNEAIRTSEGGLPDEEPELLEIQAKSWIRLYVIAVVGAVALPVVLLFIPWRPAGDDLFEWFQRSGAITVILALYAEFAVVGLYQVITPAGFASNKSNRLRKRYRQYPYVMSLIVLGLTVVGTFISSYGDIIPELSRFGVFSFLTS